MLRSTRCFARLVQCRGMATEKQLKTKINSTKNISKITKSMKMVSASKLKGDQARLGSAKPFAAWAANVTGAEVPLEDIDTSSFPQNNLIIAMTTDKGLCGGVNSILSRQTRAMLNKLVSQGKTFKIVVLGDKGRMLFRRSHGDHILSTFTERSTPQNFELASAVAHEVAQSDAECVHVVFNKFRSAISYQAMVKSIVPKLDANIEFFQSKYDIEPDSDPEALLNFHEFTLSAQLYHSLMENAASEQSSRMNAMENASKNAGEMIDKMNLQYNRARQTRITTELIEIISGAAALETKN